MLSPTFSNAFASMEDSSAVVTGNGLIFGPRKTFTSLASSGDAGGITILSLIRKEFGIEISTSLPSVRGSVMTPAKALAAAVSGLTK